MNDESHPLTKLIYRDDGRLRSGWRFAISVVLVIACNFLAGTIALGIVGGERSRLLEAIFRPILMVLELAGFFFLTSTFDRPQTSVWRYNGLQRERWLRDTAIGALLGFVMVGLGVAFIASFFKVSIVSLRVNSHTFFVSCVVLVVILCAAMVEELAFRGYPFQRLVEGMGPVGAILVLSALFGAVHLQNPHIADSRAVQFFAFSNTLYVGVVLAISYLRTRALWFPFGLHFGWNASLGLFFGLPVSGMSDFSVMVRSRAYGPQWLVGGNYGLEGGFLGTVIITLGLVYVLKYVHAPATEVVKPETSVAEIPPGSIQPSSGTAADL
ncbi:MAG TPA: type II CAAX endopeptidase family protein [Terriglobales bacterium]|nr:type II CAAX endopeptidase family protein [Terriglobales bacterium]